MYDRHLPKTNDVAAWTTCNAQLPAHLRHIQSSMQALSSLSRDRMGPCCHLGRRQHTSHRPSTCSFDSAGHRFGQGSQAQQYGDSITKNTTRNLWGGPLQTQTPQQHSMPLQSTPQPLLGAHPPLKYAQMGHSSFGRGSPHVCYLQLGGQGLFYSRAHQQQHQQQQPPRWSAIAAHITSAAAGIVGGSSRGASFLASAAGAGAAAAAVAGPSSAYEVQPVDLVSNVESSSSSSSGDEHASPPWHVVVLQGLVLAAALLVAGLLLKQFLRAVVTTLVACYSGLSFKA